MKTLLILIVRLLWGYRVENAAVLRTPGPVLLLPNHVSWLDWLFIGLQLENDWRFVTSSTTAQTSFLHRWIMINRRTFPIDPTSPYAVKRMAEYLEAGGRLVLFPEGRISITGSLMRLFPGTGFLLQRTGAKVITAYLRNARQLPYSPNSEPHHLFPRISVHFGDPIVAPPPEPRALNRSRHKVTQWVFDAMVRQQFEVDLAMGPGNLRDAILEAEGQPSSFMACQDINGKLTHRRLRLGATLIARRLRPTLDGQQCVGVLLPNVNAVPVCLLALWSLGKQPAMLNFTLGPSALTSCITLAGVRTVITSRAFLEKARLRTEPITEAGANLLFLEDIRASIPGWAKLAGLAGLIRLPRPSIHPTDTAVILFTSGSEGVPKGVQLSHRNLLANIRQVSAASDLNPSDKFFNSLPVFHSFGLTAGTLLPLVRGITVFFYPSPLLYRMLPGAVYFEGATVMLATNTFLNLYSRAAHAYDFRSVRYLIAGAEKVQSATATFWAQNYGIRILEGYGATECSPVLSVNLLTGARSGTAGRLLPGIEYRLEPVDGVAEGGRLWVKGPNIMKGYLGAANAKFAESDGWYDTGDIARVDEDGFVILLGRMKRFAKISGEMVSLTAVEDALAVYARSFGPKAAAVIVARPDEDKGERLILVTNEPRLTLADARNILREARVSNLAIPREIRLVSQIPKLGTGKTDFRALDEALAAENTTSK